MCESDGENSSEENEDIWTTTVIFPEQEALPAWETLEDAFQYPRHFAETLLTSKTALENATSNASLILTTFAAQ